MIYDSMKNFARYSALYPGYWEKLQEFFSSIAGTVPEAGSHSLDGDKLKVNIVHGETKLANEGKSEAHRDYIDIHIPLTGSETIISLADDSTMKVTDPYKEEIDCVLYESAPGLDVFLEPGYFLLVFPGEPHQPMVGNHTPIVKAIVKIAI